MIAADVWLEQLTRYMIFVTSDDHLRRAWIDADYDTTSVTGFDELYEQVFDDLDSDNLERPILASMNDKAAAESISTFLDALRSMESAIQAMPTLKNPMLLLQSREWATVQRTATRALSLLGARMD